MHVCVLPTRMSVLPHAPEVGRGYLIPWNCEPPGGYWELNWGFLKEQSVLLTELSLAPKLNLKRKKK